MTTAKRGERDGAHPLQKNGQQDIKARYVQQQWYL